MNFVVLWLAKVFSMKHFGAWVFFGTAKASNLQKFSQQKLYFSSIGKSFLPQKFSAIRQGCRKQSVDGQAQFDGHW